MKTYIATLAMMGLVSVSLLSIPVFAQQKTNETSFYLAEKEFLLEPSVSKELSERLELSKKSIPVVLQFNKVIDADLIHSLKNDNIRLTDKINGSTWVAMVDYQAVKALYSNPAIRSAVLYPKEAKLSQSVDLKSPFKWQQREEGGLAFSVLFHKGTSAKQVLELSKSLKGGRLENFNENAFVIVRSTTVVIPAEQLEQLLDSDIVQWVEPASPPVERSNLLRAQPLSNVNSVQVTPYNLSGNGITIGVWEAQAVVDTAPLDLAGRVIVEAGQTTSSHDHAVHVTGTIGASGVNVANAEGMAPAVSITSWDSAGDFGEMVNAVNSVGGAGQPTPIVVSNHSYGIPRGWDGQGTVFTNDQNVFGQYNTFSQAFDNVVAQTGLIVFKAAGNERNDAPNIAVPGQPGDCFQGGLGVAADCISDRATAKNIITVGAMNGAGAIASFSSYGPTDDGRIKPDVMAEGSSMLSLACSNCFSDSNRDGIDDVTNSTTATDVKSGTSMATPVVTGISALLLEEASDLGIEITAEGMKALMIQTAQDVNGPGQSTLGPDYSTGWGIVDAQAAVDLLRLPAGPGLAQEVITATGMAGAYTQSFYLPAGLPEAHVTLAWVDPAGNPVNPSAVQLVNDLDLRLIAPDDSIFTPWTLTPTPPGSAAVRNGGDDVVNNVEQVSLLNPVAGVWTLRVTAKAGSLALGAQNFSVAGPFNPSSGPIASTKANIMLVMDRSGSMVLPSSTGGLNKLDALKSAATELVDFIEIVGGHNMGLVQFDTNVEPFALGFDLQPLNATSAVNARSRIGGMSIGNMTNIISGVSEAQSQLNGPAATESEDIVLLFTDGKHNQPTGSNVSDIDSIMNTSTRFYSVGFGTDVDSSVMPSVASNHNGLYFEEQTLSAGQLSKLFLTIGGLGVNEDVVIDPDYPLGYLDTATQKVVVHKADNIITFGAHWDTANPQQMSFRLEGPNGKCKIPLKDHPGLKTRAGEHYRLVRVELPYKCRGEEEMHAGVWRLHATNRGSADTVKVTVLADTNFRLNTKAWGKAGVGYITATFELDGKPFVTDAKVLATLNSPLPSTGDSQKQDIYGRKYPYKFPEKIEEAKRVFKVGTYSSQLLSMTPTELGNLPFSDTTYIDKLKFKGATHVEGKLAKVELVDDGTMGDKEAGDGIYTARIHLSEKGLYQIRVTTIADVYGREVTRESLLSVFNQK